MRWRPGTWSRLDLGFQVYNKFTYPNLVGMFRELGVEESKTDMSFSVTRPNRAWSSNSLYSMGPRLLCSMRHLHGFLQRIIDKQSSKTIAEELVDEHIDVNVSAIVDYFLPFCRAVWSANQEQVMAFSALHVARFMQNHGFCSYSTRQWYTPTHRACDYLERFVARFTRTPLHTDGHLRIFTRTPVTSIHDKTIDGRRYDHIVLACHIDDALTIDGHRPHGVDHYTDTTLCVTTDETVLNPDRRLWASWNIVDDTCIYWVNSLQHLPIDENLFIVLNPRVRPKNVVYECSMRHPVFHQSMLDDARRLREPRPDGVHFCGAYMRYGFHEDGCTSGLAVANRIVASNLHLRLTHFDYVEKPRNYLYGFDTQVALRLLHTVLSGVIVDGQLIVTVPNFEVMVFGQPGQSLPLNMVSRIHLHNPIRMVRDVLLHEDIGLGESYMRGDWACDDLYLLLTVLFHNARTVRSVSAASTLGNYINALRHGWNANTLAGSKRNIQSHYDLSNAFFFLWLDETKAYSSGIFDVQSRALRDLLGVDGLEDASIAKFRRISECLQLDVGQDLHVLEIGSGWLGLSVYMAQSYPNVTITTITISDEQVAYGRTLLREKGLEGRIRLLSLDYRHIHTLGQTFDRIVSVEMIEAIGYEHVPRYFEIIAQHLRVDGVVHLQSITACDRRLGQSLHGSDFIRKHIFPGGCLTSLSELSTHATNNGLTIHNTLDIGKSYARTLRCWRFRFWEHIASIRALGYDETFIRCWDFYLTYCEAAFALGIIQDHQTTFVNHSINRHR